MAQLYICLLVAVSAAVLQLLPTEAGLLNGSTCSHKGKTNNYTFGAKSYYDKILYHDYINIKSKFMRVVSIDVTYPSNRTVPQGTIHYIEVLDARSDGTGGCAFIRNGGVGNNFVTLHLKTQRNHGMEFIINVYGR